MSFMQPRDEIRLLKARVKELEAQYAVSREECAQEAERAEAAESDLASARTLLEEVPYPLQSVSVDWIRKRDAWLASRPEPAEVTCRCIREANDAGNHGRGCPVAAPVAAPSHCGDPLCDFEDCGVAPVAAPCAGCAELRAALEAEDMRGLLQTRAFFEEIPKQYRPKTTEHRLGYLVEECGEVLAAAGKSQRWGLASGNPELPEDERENNAAWLLRELRDLKRAIGLIENDGEIHETAALSAISALRAARGG